MEAGAKNEQRTEFSYGDMYRSLAFFFNTVHGVKSYFVYVEGALLNFISTGDTSLER